MLEVTQCFGPRDFLTAQRPNCPTAQLPNGPTSQRPNFPTRLGRWDFSAIPTAQLSHRYCVCSSVCSENTMTRGMPGGAHVPLSNFSSNQTSAVPLDRLMVSRMRIEPKNQALPSDPHCPSL